MFGDGAELSAAEQAELVGLQQLLQERVRDTTPSKLVQVQRAYHYLLRIAKGAYMLFTLVAILPVMALGRKLADNISS